MASRGKLLTRGWILVTAIFSDVPKTGMGIRIGVLEKIRVVFSSK